MYSFKDFNSSTAQDQDVKVLLAKLDEWESKYSINTKKSVDRLDSMYEQLYILIKKYMNNNSGLALIKELKNERAIFVDKIDKSHNIFVENINNLKQDIYNYIDWEENQIIK